MGEKIDGKKIAEKIKDSFVKEIHKTGKRPNLAIILANQREDSKLYVSLKEKQAKQVGIDTHLYKLDQDDSQPELLKIIDFLNQDDLIDGILIQLPLPDRFNTDEAIQKIDPNKDVDCFHEENVEKVGEPGVLLSPVFSSILEIFQHIDYTVEGKQVAIIYNSDVFGDTLRELLKSKGAEVDLVQDIEKSSEVVSRADVVISAVGKPDYVQAKHIKDKAVLIDIGITKEGKQVKGDMSEKAREKSSYYTPVPGGIGPLTIAGLFKNTWEIFKHRQDNQ